MTKFSVIAFCCALHPLLWGQQEEQISFYANNILMYNPAYAGYDWKISATALCRYQWIQFAGSPKTQLLNLHSSIANKRMGIGTNLKHDQLGKRSKTELDLTLSEILTSPTNSNQLRLGVSLGIKQNTFNFNDATVNDPNDPFCNHLVYTQFTMGFGLFWSGKQYNIGISVPHFSPIKGNTNQPSHTLSAPHFYVSGSYEFILNSFFNLKTTTLFKYIPQVPATIDVNTTLVYRKQFSLGVLYRFNEGLGVQGIVQLKEKFNIGYSYEYPVNGLVGYQSGSHELMLQLQVSRRKENTWIPKF